MFKSLFKKVNICRFNNFLFTMIVLVSGRRVKNFGKVCTLAISKGLLLPGAITQIFLLRRKIVSFTQIRTVHGKVVFCLVVPFLLTSCSSHNSTGGAALESSAVLENTRLENPHSKAIEVRTAALGYDPDKYVKGLGMGAMQGAGSGAITGFQLGVGSGPGALVGAGIGALTGGIQGLVLDDIEKHYALLSHELADEKERLSALTTLKEHYKRRIELHPQRDIFPADFFFDTEDLKISKKGISILKELYCISAKKYPWSRYLIAVYVRSNDRDSYFAKKLAEERAKSLSNTLVRIGIQPRRIVTRAVIVDNPVLIDPYDNQSRYNQAIEFASLDK
jgi:outer membrane protein OmpA-like peptidoglycan-associated protein